MNNQNNNNGNNGKNTQNNHPANRSPNIDKGPRRNSGGTKHQPHNNNHQKPRHKSGPNPQARHPQQSQQQHRGGMPGGGGGRHHESNSLDQLLQQYDRLLDQHIEARKKFYELYYRCDENRLYKLEDQFYLTAQRIIKFERDLRPWQLDLLKKHRTEIYPLDVVYSSQHPDAEKFDKTKVVDVPNPNKFHISPVQLSRVSYKEDKETSEGSMEDYLQYKSMQK